MKYFVLAEDKINKIQTGKKIEAKSHKEAKQKGRDKGLEGIRVSVLLKEK